MALGIGRQGCFLLHCPRGRPCGEGVGKGRAVVPVIIFSGVPSESAELERLRPRTRLIEKPYSLVLLVETLEEMMAESGSQNLHS